MIKFIFAIFCVAIQLFAIIKLSLSYSVHKINPYEKVFNIFLREPPVLEVNSGRHYDEVKEYWLAQQLDHFDVENNETWLMRYFVNDNFYESGGPIFVFVGGEWEISPSMLQRGHFYDMAKNHAALMFYTEHRYYGKSWPKKVFSSDNLKFLNVLQSLEDLKYFVDYQKSSAKSLHSANVILAGGSYSGSMVAWFMKLYPQSAEAAWSSSAPLLAKMDFYDYMQLTMSSLEQKGGLNCAESLDQGFKGLLKLTQSSKANNLLKRLNICDNFDLRNPMDTKAFFNGLGNYFAGLVQSYSSSIPKFCLKFLTMDSNPTEALIKYLIKIFASEYKLKLEEEWCLDFSYQGMKAIFSVADDLETGTRPWFYQTCHEFGWFSTTNTSLHSSLSTSTSSSQSFLFGGQVTLKYFKQLCEDIFEGSIYAPTNVGHGKDQRLTLKQMHNRATTINQIFGGLSNVSKRVIFTHGLLDPWRAVGLQNARNVLLLKDYSHVEDMGSINLSDTVEMNVAKLKVAAFINQALRSLRSNAKISKTNK